jgi:putative membrane protein
MLLDKIPPFRYILGKIKNELTYIVVTTVIVYILTTKFEHLIPEIPLTIPTFLGTAISVILSFKLSQSYDRWWEARKIWGSIVNDSRNLVFQLQAFVNRNNQSTIKKIALRQVAWCYALGQQLRGLDPMKNTGHLLSADDRQTVQQHSNKALAILQLNNEDMAQLRAAGQIDSFNHVQLNNTMVNLVNEMGMAERIKSTIFPVTYRLFLHVIIYVFIVTLSIALRKTSGYFEIPILLLISSFFFLLEATARNLQDPFSNKPTDTAMTAIATNIEINIRQLIGDSNVPNPHQPDEFYLT